MSNVDVITSEDRIEGSDSEVLSGQPKSFVDAAKVLASYIKDGDTIRMRLEDVQSMTRHILHLRAQVHELQAMGSDLLEENRSLRAFKASVDDALNSGDGSYRP